MSDKKVSVTVIEEFRDKAKNSRYMRLGYVYDEKEERAKELEKLGKVAIGEAGAEKLKEKVEQREMKKDKNSGPNKRKRAAE